MDRVLSLGASKLYFGDTMSNIIINSDSPAKRCEICHQSDCFDPYTNECSRCASSKGAAKEPSPRKINVSVELRLKDMLGLSGLELAKALANLVGIMGILFMCISLVCFFVKGKLYYYDIYFSVGMIAYMAFIFSLVTFIKYRMLRKSIKNQRYCFEESGYEVSEEKNFSRVSWDSLAKVKETRSSFFFFFMQGYAIYHMVPKRFFSSNEDVIELRSIIKAKVGSKAKLLSNKSSFIYNPATSLVIFLVGGACLLFLGVGGFKENRKNDLYVDAINLMWEESHSKENYIKAEAILLELEKQYPDDRKIRLELARCVFYLEDYVRAEKYLLACLKNADDYRDYELAGIKERLGVCRLEQKDLAEAEKYFLDSLALSAGSSVSSYLGDIALERQDYQTAEKFYSKAIAISPDRISPRFKLASLYELTNRITDAIAQYELIEELAKKDYSELAKEAAEKKLKLKKRSK